MYTNPEWLHEVEHFVSEAIENTKNNFNIMKIDTNYKNQDLLLEEVCGAIEKKQQQRKKALHLRQIQRKRCFAVLIKQEVKPGCSIANPVPEMLDIGGFV